MHYRNGAHKSSKNCRISAPAAPEELGADVLLNQGSNFTPSTITEADWISRCICLTISTAVEYKTLCWGIDNMTVGARMKLRIKRRNGVERLWKKNLITPPHIWKRVDITGIFSDTGIILQNLKSIRKFDLKYSVNCLRKRLQPTSF